MLTMNNFCWRTGTWKKSWESERFYGEFGEFKRLFPSWD